MNKHGKILFFAFIGSLIGSAVGVYFIYEDIKRNMMPTVEYDNWQEPDNELYAQELNQVREMQPDHAEVMQVSKVDVAENHTKSMNLNAKDPETVFPLKTGSQGKEVERLQVWLQRNYGVFPQTGIYDTKTDELVKRHLKTSQVDKQLYDTHKMGSHVTEQLMVRS